jgi:hypothetical protein
MIIGIDPDLEKSGVAFFKNGQLTIVTLGFYDLIEKSRLDIEISNYKNHYLIEAGWLNQKASWHTAQNKSVAAAIGRKVGENHAVGKLLAQCLEAMGHEVTLVKPTRSKLDAKQFKAITGYEGRTNQEERDAAMLIWNLSGK